MLTERQLKTAKENELIDLIRRLEEELWRRRTGGGDGGETVGVGDSQTLETRPHADGRLQLEVRYSFTNSGERRKRGPYWYFHHHENGKQRKRYIGTEDKIKNPERALAEKREKEGW